MAQVAPMLSAGETPLAAARAVVGRFASSRLSAAAAGAGALGAALTSTSKQFVVLTDQRMIFLTQTFLGGPGETFLGQVPREQVSLAEASFGVVSHLRIAFGAAGDGVALTFPLVDKRNAEQLAAALR
ncbi:MULTISPECIES: hypothetical protein [Actinoplanes]|uniref:hypothetical protein n=1 Tax=Actinoplanes TaxID=1865 RepID=UPI0012F9894A|nr:MULTISPECIES: hypothetical protein [Actinoplanes]